MTQVASPSRTVSPAATTAAPASFVEWSPVFAGALAAAAISFVLYSFGTTVGLSLASPWPNSGLPAKLVVALAVLWFVASQIGSFLAGGYIAGRMRSRWGEAAPHEVAFRDGLHGMLVWALGIVVGAVLVLTAAASLVRGGTEAVTRVASAVASAPAASDPVAYYADILLRPRAAGAAQPAPLDPQAREEVGRILQRSLLGGGVSESDRAYLAQIVGRRAGLAPEEAQRRVEETFADAGRAARQAADKARRAGIQTGLITAISLLAALAAAWWAAQQGGRHRDQSTAAGLFGRRSWAWPGR